MAGASASLLRHVHQLVATHQIEKLTDRQLLERFAAERDEAAFALLVRRHGPMVLGLCRRMLGHEQDAEDAFQAAFLILARKAGSIRQADVGGFLYRVAYHLAGRARSKAVKRSQRERRGAAMPAADPMTEVTWREVRAVVDEELQRLSEALRSAVVLCYLEGKTHEEAARLLGWSKNTLRRRLERGRELLRLRLLARGLAPAAALTATLFAEGTAPAAVSALLVSATVHSVLHPAPLAPAVAALVEAGSAMLSISKAKVATAILLAASLLGAVGGFALSHKRPAEPPAAKADDKPRTAPSKPEPAKTVEVQGRVLDPDGKPKAGAKLLLLGRDGEVKQLGVSAADGRFTVTIPKEPKYRSLFRDLVAQADGFGIDFIGLRRDRPAEPVELRLVKDNVIRGRVVNTEGKPVRGVRVAVAGVDVHINNSLDTFLDAWMKLLLANGKGTNTAKALWAGTGELLATPTDADGRFALHGIGTERTARLRLSGGGIADTSLWIANRAGFDPKLYNQTYREQFGRVKRGSMLSGPDVAVVAEAEKVIRGVVADADTGKGQPGLVVALTGYWDDMMPPFHLKAKTNAEGRYEIHGVRKAKKYLIQFAIDAVAGYRPSQVWAEDTTGYQPVSADLKVKKGVIVTGKVIDGATGAAIPGSVGAAVLSGNPFDKDYPKFQTPSPAPFVAQSANMDDDGTFRLVAIPGPVLLMGGPNHQLPMGGPFGALKYKPAVADPKYPQYFQVGPGAFLDEIQVNYFGLNGLRRSVDGNFCKVLDIKPGIALVKQDIVLERASALTVKIQDAEGRPLSGVLVAGVSPRNRYRALRMENDSCPVYHLEAGKPRLMVFCEPSRKLAATRTLKGDEKAPVVVKLGAMGAIKGRLLDADGKPCIGAIVDLHYRESQAEGLDDRIREGELIVTDAKGVFTCNELLPELKFELTFRHGKQKFERATKPADPTVQVKPGESRDLGALKLKRVAEKRGE